MRGSQAPVASQKGATVPLGSSTGTSLTPKRHPEVPSEATNCPGLWGE